jgi:hypothetical protein
MRIYFEDGELVNAILLPQPIDFKLDAGKGFTHVKSRLDAIQLSDMSDVNIYTNSIAALNVEYFNSTGIPELYLRDNRHGSFTRVDALIKERQCFYETEELIKAIWEYLFK